MLEESVSRSAQNRRRIGVIGKFYFTMIPATVDELVKRSVYALGHVNVWVKNGLQNHKTTEAKGDDACADASAHPFVAGFGFAIAIIRRVIRVGIRWGVRIAGSN